MIFDRYRFDEQLAMELGEKILLAIVALVITWLAARAAKWAFAKLVDAVDFFKRGTGSAFAHRWRHRGGRAAHPLSGC